MSRDFDFLVFIGRFQPFHEGHLSVVREGLRKADKLIVLFGSAFQPPSLRNPWSVEEREQMLRACLNEDENRRVITAPLMDAPYNDDAWVRNVQATVQGLAVAHFQQPHRKPVIGLIGHEKDHTSYYLNLFPQWSATHAPNLQDISSTPLREAYLREDAGSAWLSQPSAHALPAPVREQLDHYASTSAFQEIAAESAFIREYRKAWDAAPYAPMFITVDAVVVQSGHILLIERKARPGKGLWALPGGFLDANERVEEACLRELREETRLKIPAPVLKGSIRSQEVFDAPHRSARGRTVTHAFLIELTPAAELPKVRGGDDARHAFWLPLAELEPMRLFEDHYYIIQKMLGL
ncbi:Cytidyltransferase-related [gamma proteobacterium HdN1]|nr:Cytidyltransferase-related [gamma proteobacterium HdN1]